MSATQNISHYLAALNQVLIANGSNLTEIFRHVYPILAEVIRTDAFFAGVYDSHSDTIEWQFMSVSNQLIQRKTRPEDDELINIAIQQVETVYSNVKKRGIFSIRNGKEVCLKEKRVLSNAGLAAPIISDSKIVGILSATSVAAEAYSDSEAHLLSLIARIAGLKIECSALKGVMAERNKLQSIVDLANSLGHELNQPLTGITGYCALIKEEMLEGETVYNDIVEIEKQALRLESMVHEFQNLLQIENFSKKS